MHINISCWPYLYELYAIGSMCKVFLSGWIYKSIHVGKSIGCAYSCHMKKAYESKYEPNKC